MEPFKNKQKIACAVLLGVSSTSPASVISHCPIVVVVVFLRQCKPLNIDHLFISRDTILLFHLPPHSAGQLRWKKKRAGAPTDRALLHLIQSRC